MGGFTQETSQINAMQASVWELFVTVSHLFASEFITPAQWKLRLVRNNGASRTHFLLFAFLVLFPENIIASLSSDAFGALVELLIFIYFFL